jgi:hypothetical protein
MSALWAPPPRASEAADGAAFLFLPAAAPGTAYPPAADAFRVVASTGGTALAQAIGTHGDRLIRRLHFAAAALCGATAAVPPTPSASDVASSAPSGNPVIASVALPEESVAVGTQMIAALPAADENAEPAAPSSPASPSCSSQARMAPYRPQVANEALDSHATPVAAASSTTAGSVVAAVSALAEAAPEAADAAAPPPQCEPASEASLAAGARARLLKRGAPAPAAAALRYPAPPQPPQTRCRRCRPRQWPAGGVDAGSAERGARAVQLYTLLHRDGLVW